LVFGAILGDSLSGTSDDKSTTLEAWYSSFQNMCHLVVAYRFNWRQWVVGKKIRDRKAKVHNSPSQYTQLAASPNPMFVIHDLLPVPLLEKKYTHFCEEN
jgi:hypothetical protein